jgi:hypothetical protein
MNSVDPDYPSVPKAATAKNVSAADVLLAAEAHMRERAVTYNSQSGERSMKATVAAFNAITGKTLRESEGWLFMQILKDVRDRTCPEGHRDSLEDCVAYASLKAEARLAGR